VTVSDSASLPAWAKKAPAAPQPPANTAEGNWEHPKQNPAVEKEIDLEAHTWTKDGMVPEISAQTSRAVELLKSKNPDNIHEGLQALEKMLAVEHAPAVAELLSNEDLSIVAHALRTLGLLKAGQYADRIVALAGQKPDLREFAMEALAVLDAPRAVALAVEHLRITNAGSSRALEVLEQHGTAELGRTLAGLLVADSEDVILRGCKALVAVRAVEQAPGVLAVVQSLTHSTHLRREALEALVSLDGARPVGTRFAPVIADLLRDEQMVWDAVHALSTLRAVEYAPRIRAVMEESARRGGADKYADAFQILCIRTLLDMAAMSRPEAVHALAMTLEHTDQFGSDSGLRLLRELNAIEGVEIILRLAGHPPPSEWIGKDFSKENPYEVLNYLGFRRHCREIAWFLQSPEEAVRLGALAALEYFQAAECVAEIAAILAPEETERVLVYALAILGRLRGHEIVPSIRTLLHTTESEKVRVQAMQTLVALQAPGAAAEIADFTASTFSQEERLEALQAILLLDPPAALDRAAAMLAPREEAELRIAVLALLARKDLPRAPALAAALLTEAHGRVLYAALTTLRETGSDSETPAVAVLLPHEDPGIRRAATELLCALGPAGRRRVIQEIAQPELWNLGLRAVMEHGEATAGDLTASGEWETKTRVLRANYWAMLRPSDVAGHLAADLLDGHQSLRLASLSALVLCGGGSEEVVPLCVEAALQFPRERGPLMLAAYLFSAGDTRTHTMLPWLDNQKPESSPAITDPGLAKEIIASLATLWRSPAMAVYPQLRRAAVRGAARVATATAWRATDLSWLEVLAEELRSVPAARNSAEAVANVAEQVRLRAPVLRILRTVMWTLVIQPLVWMLVLLVYPWSALAQGMVWSRWIRKLAGFGWVGPLIVRVPWLRERMWRPFREALVPPGEVVSFDEWTFFDAVRVKQEGVESQPALRVLEARGGVTVLRGESGLGKTTLLQALAGRASRPVALLRAVECSGGLMESLRSRLPRRARGDAAFLRGLVIRGSPDILVDAVHEALPEVRAKLSAEVESLAGANVLLTTQPVEWTPPTGAAVWQLEPLRVQDISPFLLKQGTAAVEAAGAGSLAERQRAFAARAAAFLDELEKLPPESARAVSLRRMLGNPMEAVLAAELLAAGQTPDPDRLLEQRMEHLTEDYTVEHGGEFPGSAFAEHLRSWRASGAPLLRLDVFAGVASFLARHRLLRKMADGAEAWRFRHDKIMEWFLRAAG